MNWTQKVMARLYDVLERRAARVAISSLDQTKSMTVRSYRMLKSAWIHFCAALVGDVFRLPPRMDAWSE